MTTMNEAYGDGSPHKCCSNCGYCEACGDCNKHGCQLGPLPEPEGYWSEDLPPNYTAEQMRAYALQERAAEHRRSFAKTEALRADLAEACRMLEDCSAVAGIGPDAALHWFARRGELCRAYRSLTKDQ